MFTLALANAAIVIILTQTSLFKSFRDMLPNTPIINFNKLFHCTFCLTPWFSALLVTAYLPYVSLSDVIIKIFALTTMTSIFAFLLLLYLNLLEEINE